MTQTDVPDPVVVGNDVTYTVTVTNGGPDAATTVVLTDSLPADASFVSASADQGSCSQPVGGKAECQLGSIASGGKATATIKVATSVVGVMTNTASVTAVEEDSNASNNSSAEETTVRQPYTADLSLTLVDAPDPIPPGNQLSYTVTVTNIGPDDATAVALIDDLPPEADYQLSTTTQGSCEHSAGRLNCQLGSLPNKSTATVTILVTVPTAGTVTNKASATATEPDPDGSNNGGSAVTTVQKSAPPTLQVSVADYSFSPKTATARQGATVQWLFKGPHAHTATDRSGMSLFTSGKMPAGASYSFPFTSAGSYRYRCTLHTTTSTSHIGTVQVPLKASPANGETTTTFTVTWSSAPAPAEFVFDVQLKRPGATAFASWQTSVTTESASFTPDAGAGIYSFRARLRKPLVAKASLWSPVLSMQVDTPVSASPNAPNIVLVVTDDQRWDDLSVMPIVRRTLVQKGVNFSNAFVPNPICCPSRASILTGQFNHSNGVWQNGGPYGGFPRLNNSSTVATWLHASGYRTALVGKYINGYCDSNSSYIPPGWDRWVAFTMDSQGGCGQGDYFNYRLSIDGESFGYGKTAGEYSTDVLAAEATSFIRTTPEGRPLFLYFATKAPHKHSIPAPRHANAFSDLPPARPPNYNEADVSDKPSWVRSKPLLSATMQQTLDSLRLKRLRTLLAVDEAVGHIVNALEQTGRLSNTLIAFISDNGYFLGEHRLSEKGAAYDEASRVPLVVRYDRVIDTPREDANLVMSIDLAPTFADAAGVSAPRADGKSFLSLLRSPGAPWRNDFLMEHMKGAVPSYCGVRNARFAYLQYAAGEEELYDMSQDPYQLNNRARDPAFAEMLKAMRSRVRELCDPPPPGFALSF